MNDALAILREQFLERCRSDFVQLSRCRADSEAFASLVHRLAGAAGSFGFPQVSAAAGVVDLRIRNREEPTSAEFEGLMEALENAIDRRTDG